MRKLDEITGEIEAIEAGDKKQPAKLGSLRKELLAAQEARIAELEEKAAARGLSPTLRPAPAPAAMPYNAGATFCISDSELIDRVLERRVADPRPIGSLNILWNSIRKAVYLRRIMSEKAGIQISGRRIDLPNYNELGIDSSGDPIEVKPEPVPVVPLAFETEVEQAAREAREADDRAQRIAQAQADTRRGQLTQPTDRKREKARIEAELANAGAPPGMPTL